ncbi:serine/threonine-protein kinase, partial [Rubrivirga sp.]|uniref:serine/threonine-protein kinase n=1 Tax=Rubrivirga sp. TaxID=1885344 RepID=UPI003C747FA6
MATVYKALDQTSGKVVVLKKVHTYDPERRERFTAEARLAAGVEHPNVVQVLHVTDDSLVAEWVEGADLDDVVADVGALPPELAVFVAYETALGLEAVHQAGILHRDVSAANVLLGLEGEVKLTDFGLASLADDEGDQEVRGTLGTLAPEIIKGEAPSLASDLFSLGAVLVHALTGRAPFASGDTSSTLDAVLHLDPAAALVGDPRVPATLVEIAESLLDKEPSSRPASAAVVADQLSDVLQALGSPGPGHLASFLNAPDAYKSPEPRRKRKHPLPPPAPQRRAAESATQPAP